MDAEEKIESEIYARVWAILASGADIPLLETGEHLAALAKRLGCVEPDRQALRKAYMRVFLTEVWHRIEAHYGYYADRYRFEHRLDSWLEVFCDVARPLYLWELIKRHMAENPKMPLICDINARLCQRDRIAAPCHEEAREKEGSTPGYAQQLFREWQEKRKAQ